MVFRVQTHYWCRTCGNQYKSKMEVVKHDKTTSILWEVLRDCCPVCKSGNVSPHVTPNSLPFSSETELDVDHYREAIKLACSETNTPIPDFFGEDNRSK